jgi:hypothetical protein
MDRGIKKNYEEDAPDGARDQGAKDKTAEPRLSAISKGMESTSTPIGTTPARMQRGDEKGFEGSSSDKNADENLKKTSEGEQMNSTPEGLAPVSMNDDWWSGDQVSREEEENAAVMNKARIDDDAFKMLQGEQEEQDIDKQKQELTRPKIAKDDKDGDDDDEKGMADVQEELECGDAPPHDDDANVVDDVRRAMAEIDRIKALLSEPASGSTQDASYSTAHAVPASAALPAQQEPPPASVQQEPPPASVQLSPVPLPSQVKESKQNRLSNRLMVDAVETQQLGSGSGGGSVGGSGGGSGTGDIGLTTADMQQFFARHDATKLFGTSQPADEDVEEFVTKSSREEARALLEEVYGDSPSVLRGPRQQPGHSDEPGRNEPDLQPTPPLVNRRRTQSGSTAPPPPIMSPPPPPPPPQQGQAPDDDSGQQRYPEGKRDEEGEDEDEGEEDEEEEEMEVRIAVTPAKISSQVVLRQGHRAWQSSEETVGPELTELRSRFASQLDTALEAIASQYSVQLQLAVAQLRTDHSKVLAQAVERGGFASLVPHPLSSGGARDARQNSVGP